MAYVKPNTFVDGTTLTAAAAEGNFEALRVYLHEGISATDFESSTWIQRRHIQPPDYEPFSGVQHGVSGHQGGQWAGSANIRMTFATKFLTGNGQPDATTFHHIPNTSFTLDIRRAGTLLFHYWFELECGNDNSTASYQVAEASRAVFVAPWISQLSTAYTAYQTVCTGNAQPELSDRERIPERDIGDVRSRWRLWSEAGDDNPVDVARNALVVRARGSFSRGSRRYCKLGRRGRSLLPIGGEYARRNHRGPYCGRTCKRSGRGRARCRTNARGEEALHRSGRRRARGASSTRAHRGSLDRSATRPTRIASARSDKPRPLDNSKPRRFNKRPRALAVLYPGATSFFANKPNKRPFAG